MTSAEFEGDKEETVEQSEQSQQEMSQVRVSTRSCTTYIFRTHLSALVLPKNYVKY